MLRLARIVAAREHEQPVVVVSALARVTDGLVSLAESVRQGHGAALDAAVETLHDRHRAVAHELEGGEAALPALDAAFAELRRVLRPAVGRVLAPAERDFLLGQGELWSSRLVEAALTGSTPGRSSSPTTAMAAPRPSSTPSASRRNASSHRCSRRAAFP